MASPFPGMDPYLEAHWGDIHASLIIYARDQLRDVCLLWRELVACLDAPNPSVLAGCAQLDAGSFREGLHTEVAEETMREAQLFARVDVATSAAQPLAVHQVSPRAVELQPRRSQKIDGGAIPALGVVALARQPPQSRRDRSRPGSAARGGRDLETLERRDCGVDASAAARGFHELDRR